MATTAEEAKAKRMRSMEETGDVFAEISSLTTALTTNKQIHSLLEKKDKKIAKLKTKKARLEGKLSEQQSENAKLVKEIGELDQYNESLQTQLASFRELVKGFSAADSSSSAVSDDNSDDSDGDEKPAATTKTPPGAKPTKRGLQQEKAISDELAAFLGKGKLMSRTEIVKALWEYFRKHNLQNPSNKKEIILDKPMRKVFGCKTFTIFTMNKYISAHVHPFKPVDLTSPSSTSKRKATANDSCSKKKHKAGK